MSGVRLRLVARVPRPRSPAARFVAGSAVLHVVLAIVIAFFPSLRPKSKPIEDYIVVTPVGAPAAAAPAPAEVAPALPEPEPDLPEPEPEQVRVEPKVPEPKPLPPPEKKPEKKPAEDKQPPQRPRAETATPPSTAPAPGEASGPGGLAGTSIESVDFQDLEFAWYRDRVVAALKSQWRQPILDGVTTPLSVTIAFRVLRNGAVRDPEIVATSGVASLDRSALRAVVEADPLPPLPPNWREPVMSARFVFTWYP